MKFLADHFGWLVVCALLLIYVVFPSWGGPCDALDKPRRNARKDVS